MSQFAVVEIEGCTKSGASIWFSCAATIYVGQQQHSHTHLTVNPLSTGLASEPAPMASASGRFYEVVDFTTVKIPTVIGQPNLILSLSSVPQSFVYKHSQTQSRISTHTDTTLIRPKT
jgi:hypothetical protein